MICRELVRNHRQSRRRAPRWLVMLPVAIVIAVASPSGYGPADARPSSCDRPVVLVGEVASTTASLEGLRRDLDRAGMCATVLRYGSTPLSTDLARAGGPRLNGLTSLEDSGRELVGLLRSTSTDRPLTVVAHGGGALAVQYALSHGVPAGRVTRLVTMGPLWNGTDVAGIADIEQISRRLGTYDTVLGLERPIIDPICASCRQLVTGSDFLVTMRRIAFPTPGVSYVDIISRTDGLSRSPRHAAAPGSRAIILQSVDPQAKVDHFRLPTDRLVRSLVVDNSRG